MPGLLPLLVLVGLLAGCGGSGVESRPGGEATTRSASARFSILWPEASKLIPIAAKAVQIDVLQGATKVATKVAARGAAGSTSVLDIENLPAGKLTFEASALPNLDLSGSSPTASGVPQAKGTAPLTTEPGKTAKVTITMASTIDRLVVFPNPWKLEKLKPSVPARATAYDAQNRVVLTDPDRQFTWSSSNTGIVDVSPNSGAVNANEKGFATLTVRDRESGKTATGQVEVVDELPVDRVVISPETASLEIGKTFTVTATALDAEGEDLGYTSDKFIFASSDPTKATVSETGVVTGIEVGVATIEVKEKITGKSGTCVVTLQTVEPANLLIYGRYNGLEGYGKIVSETEVEFIGPYDYRTRFVSRVRNRRIYTQDISGDNRTVRHLHVSDFDGQDDHDILQYDSRYLDTYFPDASGDRLLVMIAQNPTYLPDGRRDLFVIDARTGAIAPWTFPSAITEPFVLNAWSPVGDRYVATNVRRDAQGVGELDIAVYNRDGLRLNPISIHNLDLHFSADGNLIVQRKGISGRPAEIIVYDRNGALLYNYSVGVNVASVQFHPTRNTLVYVGIDSNNGFQRVYECNPDGSNNHVVFSGSDPYLNQINLFWR